MSRSRAAAAVVGLPAALVLLADVAFAVLGFPVSLLLLPLLLPVGLLGTIQVTSSRRLWRRGTAPAFAASCVFGLSLWLFVAGVVSGTLDLDGQPDDPLWPATIVALALAGPSLVGLVLMGDRSTLSSPRFIGSVAVWVLLAALLVVVTLPVPGR